jgi:hypothetical protein
MVLVATAGEDMATAATLDTETIAVIRAVVKLPDTVTTTPDMDTVVETTTTGVETLAAVATPDIAATRIVTEATPAGMKILGIRVAATTRAMVVTTTSTVVTPTTVEETLALEVAATLVSEAVAILADMEIGAMNVAGAILITTVYVDPLFLLSCAFYTIHRAETTLMVKIAARVEVTAR